MALMPAIFFVAVAKGQINSPYSRFGLGDLYNARNVVNKGMGNLATAYSDLQSVNFINPASYTSLQTVTFDVGMEAEMRTIYNADRTVRNQSANMIFNYVALGMPIMKDKKGFTKMGLTLGLRPFTRINYKIEANERLPGIDSVSTLYQGNGGSTKAFLGLGYRLGGLSVGVNAGFFFGNQTINTQRTFKNDSIFHFNSMQQDVTYYSRFSLDGGVQYKIKLSKDRFIRLGANGFLGDEINATQDRLRQTFIYNGNNGTDSIDVVERTADNKGQIVLPSGYNVGFQFEKASKWMIGAEYESISWTDYRFFGQSDNMANSTQLRVGGYFIPGAIDGKTYASRITYRAGFYTGKDKIVANGTQLPIWGATFGFGLPIKRFNAYSNQFTSINTSFEYGRRGNGSVPVSENFFRINVGLSLSDLWFFKRRFD
jgi:hypothetical protein